MACPGAYIGVVPSAPMPPVDRMAGPRCRGYRASRECSHADWPAGRLERGDAISCTKCAPRAPRVLRERPGARSR